MKKNDWQHNPRRHPRPQQKKVRTPPAPAIASEIRDKHGNLVHYDPKTKDIMAPGQETTTSGWFRSRKEAHTALWHILQNPANLGNAPYTIEDYFPF